MRRFYIKQILLTIAVLLCGLKANAYDFEADGVYYNILSMEDLTVEVTYKSCNQIDYNEFEYISDYCGDIVIPSAVTIQSKTLTVTSIGHHAFNDCKELTGVTVSNSVTNLGDYAFSGCGELTTIIIGNSVTNIGRSAFSGCHSLISVVIPNSVTEICPCAFEDCTNLSSVIIGNSVTSIGGGSFLGCSSLTSVVIPNSVTKIGSRAFLGCNFGDATIIIPNSVTEISVLAFGSIKDLRIEDGDSILLLEDVYGMSDPLDGSYEYIYLGRNIKGRNSFKEDIGLKHLTIGNNVTSIREEEFNGCDSLTNIYLMGTNPPSVGDNNFTNAHYMNTTIYVPKGHLATYQEADVWKLFWNVQEHELATSIEDIETDEVNFSITSNGISLLNADNSAVAIYSINGILVEKIDKYTGEEIVLNKGVYIVCVGDKAVKIKL